MEKEQILVNGTEDGLPRAVRATYGKTKTSAALCDYNSKPTLIMEKETEPKIIQNPHGFQKGSILDNCPTITSSAFQDNNFLREATGWRIRKLSERECFRLMDMEDSDIDKIKAAGISKTAQYHLAGNSICVGVLTEIFRKMFIDRSNESRQLELF